MQQTVLIVDSEATTRSAIAASLRDMDLHSEEVVDANAAMRYLQARMDCVLILTTVNAHTSEPLRLIDCASSVYPDIPVILLVNSPRTSLVVEAFRRGLARA